jgi:chorismate-pyruvate lyase
VRSAKGFASYNVRLEGSAVHPPIPDLMELVGMFYADSADLAEFAPVAACNMPQPYRDLLAHEHHMTVTVEKFHGCPVDVRVLEYKSDPPHYARKILLARQSDGAIVQYGIVRIDLDQVDPPARDEILARNKPLGRILIEHNVFREVELVDLWRVEPGEDLKRLFGVSHAETTYGRTALIHCNGSPAVELLEIIVPTE